jgi:hypothetical protein
MHTPELPTQFKMPNRKVRRMHLQAQPSRNKSAFFGIRKQFVNYKLFGKLVGLKVILHRPKPSMGVYIKHNSDASNND